MEQNVFSPAAPEARPLWELPCLQAVRRSFAAGETAYTYGEGQLVGVIQEGAAALVKIDAGGGRTVLERLAPGGVFGEGIAFPTLPCDSVTLVCETPCQVLFLPRERLSSPCGNHCEGHAALLESLLPLLAKKAFDLSERVEVLSCRTTREKLLCCFRIFAFQEKSLAFTLPFSLSALAEYLCADRSAMMRELKKLKDEGYLEVSGRQVRFLSDKPFGQADLCAASLR